MPNPGEAFTQALNPQGLAQQQYNNMLLMEKYTDNARQQQAMAQKADHDQRMDQVKVLGEAFKGANTFQQQSIIKQMFAVTNMKLPDNFFPEAGNMAVQFNILANTPGDSAEHTQAAAQLIQLLPPDSAKAALDYIQKQRQAKGFGQMMGQAGMEGVTSQQAEAMGASNQMQEELGKTLIQSPVAKAAARSLQERATHLEQVNAINVETIRTFTPIETDAETFLGEANKYRKVMNQVGSAGKDSPLRSRLEGQEPADGTRTSLTSYKEQLKQRLPETEKTLIELSGQLRDARLAIKDAVEDEGPGSSKLLFANLRKEALERSLAVKEAESAYFNNPSSASLASYQRATGALQGFHSKLSANNSDLRKEMLSLKQQSLAFSQQRYDTQALYNSQVANAQVEVAKMGVPTESAEYLPALGDIAQKHGVKVSDIAPAGKNVNKPSTEVVIAAPGEREKLAMGEGLIGRLGNIEAAFKPEYVGFLDKPIGAFKSATNLISDAEASFRAQVLQYAQTQRHEIYGSALSAGEKKLALSTIPDLGMGAKEFQAAISESKKWEQTMLEKRRAEIGKASATKQGATKGRKTFHDRMAELQREGKSKQEAFNQLYEEGYR